MNDVRWHIEAPADISIADEIQRLHVPEHEQDYIDQWFDGTERVVYEGNGELLDDPRLVQEATVYMGHLVPGLNQAPLILHTYSWLIPPPPPLPAEQIAEIMVDLLEIYASTA